MKNKISFSRITLLLFLIIGNVKAQTNAIVSSDLVFEEVNGIVAIEAEYFYKQSKSENRQWYRTSKNETPSVGRDEDVTHILGASNNAYLEILPDTRVTHSDKLIHGESFSATGGDMAVLHYKVNINTPGKYFVWVRAYSVGSEDNGIHVGIDGEWPESGQRMQWCKGKDSWKWGNSKRTDKVHCGVPGLIFLDIDKAGPHEIVFSMREDGFEFDKFILTTDPDFKPGEGVGPVVKVKSGSLPATYPAVTKNPIQVVPYVDIVGKSVKGSHVIKAVSFPVDNNDFYVDKNKWLAVDPNKTKEAATSRKIPFNSGMYDVVFVAVGENDGNSEYKVYINDTQIGEFKVPMSSEMFAEGPNHNDLWENIEINKGDKITVQAKVGTDGTEYSRGRWSGIVFTPMTKGKTALVASAVQKEISAKPKKEFKEPELIFSDINKRGADGDAPIEISGELKQWHKVTLTLDGPFAHELDKELNAFTDYNMMVNFTHASGSPSYNVPGYFAADGNAGETSADCGTKWRAHLSPDKAGTWNYTLILKKGKNAAQEFSGEEIAQYSNLSGEFKIGKTDKKGRDFRAKGRLEYVGKHHLQFQGTKEYFVKAGPDAPETLLGFVDFDATYTVSSKGPLKKYEKHIDDWEPNYPTWKDGKGKGLIGAIGYLSNKGANAFSFLTYNSGGDGDNVWPFIKRNEKFNYDCSKLDQWGIVFDFAQQMGMYLHFKTQETENDDNNIGHKEDKIVTKVESLDGGDLGLERKLYYRELVARFGYLLALNWNFGEENTQTTKQQQDMIAFIDQIQVYKHNLVLHTFPSQQEKVYKPLLGDNSKLTGLSLQNNWNKVFEKTLLWRTESANAGVSWVVANDEQGSAGQGVPPDPNYNGFEADKLGYDLHDIRKQTLYGNLMAGGAGVEYYFGYKLPENDLRCEDWRSRDMSWDYCKIALDFFHAEVPFQDMENADNLIGNLTGDKDKHCLALKGEYYLIHLAYVNTTEIDLSNVEGTFKVKWFNPRSGGEFQTTTIKKIKGGSVVDIGMPPTDLDQDWLVVITK